ncbi:MAG: class I SAM-dependent methyltransferase [Planctomycetales bacterium]|nr:class I SAM-dependent methyltransferase [Planctomycetales bacterium]
MIVERARSFAKAIVPQRMRRALRPATIQRRLALAMKKAKCFGIRRQCPICQSRLRNFLPGGLNHPVLEEKQIVGGGRRRCVHCPVCNATDRERLLYLYLTQRTDLFHKPMRLLHVAPEHNLRQAIRRHANIEYLSADLSGANVMVAMDITDIQYPDNSFDAILCSHVLEHVPDDRQAMREISRVLAPQGWAILQVPISLVLEKTYENPQATTPEQREREFGQLDHVRIYGQDYPDRLRKAGFAVDVFDWTAADSGFGGPANRFGLIPEERVFHVTKPSA